MIRKRNFFRQKSTVVSACIVLVLAPSFAHTDPLPYETGFEQPDFELGLVNGQDDWDTFYSVEASIISETNPKSGLQSLEMIGASLVPFSAELMGTLNRRSFTYDGYIHGTPLVEIIVDAQLAGEPTDEDLVSTNLVPYVEGLYLGTEMLLSSSGDVWICAYDPEIDEYGCNTAVPVGLGEYHRLGQRIDFSTGTSQFFLNGELITKFPIGPWVPNDLFFKGLFLELYAVNDPDLVDPSGYTAYHDNLSIKTYRPVPFDVKPADCPSLLNVDSRGVLPVAILGTETLDVTEIDPKSIRLFTAQGGEAIEPLRCSIEDVATPYEPFTGKETELDCNEFGPDGYLDMVLKFDQQEIAENLGTIEDREIKLITVTGKLKKAYRSTPIMGEDMVQLIVKE